MLFVRSVCVTVRGIEILPRIAGAVVRLPGEVSLPVGRETLDAIVVAHGVLRESCAQRRRSRRCPFGPAQVSFDDYFLTSISLSTLLTLSTARASSPAVVFFIIALIAAVFGFAGIAAGAAGIAKILFFVFLILAVVSFIANTARR